MARALALLSGVLLAASFPKYGHPAFAWTALAPLLIAVVIEVQRTAAQSPRRSHIFLLGWIAGFVHFSLTVSWVVEVMNLHGGLPVVVAWLVMFLLAAYLALYPALCAVLVGRSIRRFGLVGLWLAPLLWVGTEWLRGWVGGGFPWALLGTSQAGVTPIIQLASVTGVFGVSLLLALVSTAAAALALTRERAHMVAAVATLGLVAAVAALGTWRVAGGGLVTQGPVLKVGLLQGNVEQNQKWDPAFKSIILDRYLTLSRQVIDAGARLVVWPEASTPFFLEAEAVAAAPIRVLARETRTPMIIGTDEYERDADGDRIYNSAVAIGEDGMSVGGYRKMQLVPFGEYVPLKSLLFFVGPLVEKVSDFAPGTEPTVLSFGGTSPQGGIRTGVAICYEVVYPWIPRAFAAGGAEFLTTITNDAWFGRSSAPYQHFAQASVRAVENGRYLVRSANTGISGVVDPYGRTLLTTPLFAEAAVTADVRLIHSRTIYSYAGDVVAWLGLVVCAWLAWPLRRASS
jgi:apolipoprotein N-acyltransferase